MKKGGHDPGFTDITSGGKNAEPEDDDWLDSDDNQIGDKIRIDLADMNLTSWKRDLEADQAVIEALLAEMQKVTPEDDAKLQQAP